jgi:phenylpropionate dioxygenase-like ring-hydroxylating dioxygenase large terminal subunit
MIFHPSRRRVAVTETRGGEQGEMLTKEENELVCHVGPGTPMGNYLRSFWTPIMLATELPTPDCPPVRVRIMGENLVAFKDTDSNIGLIDEVCPHRRVSLFWGRNEDHGLRCVYHGWKFDTSGNCVDMPSEPAEYEFKRRVKTTAYPAQEYGGLIWAYMGPPEQYAELPEMEWALVPDSHRYISKRFQDNNYLQAIEGGIDSSHISFLHRSFQRPANAPAFQDMDTSPRFTVNRTDYGLLIGARRNAEDDSYYWRITQYLLPGYTMIPGSLDPKGDLGGHIWVPMDDDHTWTYSMSWNPTRPLTEEEIASNKSGMGIHTEVDENFRAVRNALNNYQIDREAQRTRSFTGIKGINEQDQAMQESMGPIVDRSLERLGTSDTAVIAMRRVMLNGCRALMENGTVPYAAQHGAAYRVRSTSVVLRRDVQWDEAAKERLKALV